MSGCDVQHSAAESAAHSVCEIEAVPNTDTAAVRLIIRYAKDEYERFFWIGEQNPGIVDEGLAENILRDSCDPGAVGVIAAGGKLPFSRSANEMLGKFGVSAIVVRPASRTYQ